MFNMNKELQVVWSTDLQDHIVDLTIFGDQVVVGLSQGDVIGLTSNDGQIKHKYKTHGLGVFRVGTSPNGQYMFSTGEDGVVYIYQTETTEPSHCLRLKGWIEHAQFSPDSKYLAFSSGRSLHIYNIETREKNQYDDFVGTISGLQWADAEDIWVSSYKRLSQFRVNDSKSTNVYEWQGSLTSMILQPKGRFAVCPSQDQTVHIWDIQTGDDFEMSGFDGKVKAMDFLSSGSQLIIGDGPNLLMWNFEGKGPEGRQPKILGEQLGVVMQVCSQINSSFVASGSTRGELSIWDLRAGGSLYASGGKIDHAVRSLVWLDQQLIVGHDPGVLVCYKVV